MQDQFEHVSYFRFLNCTKLNPLSFFARLVYSYLAFRDRVGQSENVTHIRETLGIYHPAHNALIELSGLGLVKEVDGQYRALPPSAEQEPWYSWKAKSKPDDHWSSRCHYFRWYLADVKNPMSVKQLAFYYLALDMERNGRLMNLSGAATILATTRFTIHRTIDYLEQNNICNFRTDDMGTDVFPQLLKDCEGWWKKQKVEEQPAPNWQKHARECCTAREYSRIKFAVAQLVKVYPVCPPEGRLCPYTFQWLNHVDVVIAELAILAQQKNDWEKYDKHVKLWQHLIQKESEKWKVLLDRAPLATFYPYTEPETKVEMTPLTPEQIGFNV